jgi:hypothetical protein
MSIMLMGSALCSWDGHANIVALDNQGTERKLSPQIHAYEHEH